MVGEGFDCVGRCLSQIRFWVTRRVTISTRHVTRGRASPGYKDSEDKILSYDSKYGLLRIFLSFIGVRFRIARPFLSYNMLSVRVHLFFYVRCLSLNSLSMHQCHIKRSNYCEKPSFCLGLRNPSRALAVGFYQPNIWYST